MKLGKAIQILNYKLQFLNFPDLIEFKDAIKLGIEAAIWIQQSRITTPDSAPTLLPGETED